ncbi:MAG: SPOR domain-containing protein [Bacteroides sp.]
MIELAQHIEVLLLENDCVIIPGFGGFITHYAPAVRIESEHLFLPPTRTIGFNPQLKLNDGVLVQSYMTVYDANFPDATTLMEKEVNQLIATLHEEGKVDLANIGEIRYTIQETYQFIPYDDKITTPYLYGLDSFEMKELSALPLPKEKEFAPVVQKEKRSYEIKINRTFLRNAVATVAAIALFFFLSIPVENTYIDKGNYARLLPTDLFEKIEKQSVAMTPVVLAQTSATANKKKPVAQRAAVRKPIIVKEIKVAKAPETPAAPQLQEGHFHIIVAGGIGRKNAETMATELKAQGFAKATVLNDEGKIRVSIQSFSTAKEATKQLLQLRKNEAYQNAWMLAR